MKRAVSFVLAATMLIGSPGFAFAGRTGGETEGGSWRTPYDKLLAVTTPSSVNTSTSSAVNATASGAATTAPAVTGSAVVKKTVELKDIKGKDCEDAVNVLLSLGVVSGYEDGTYQPTKAVTRAEMAVLLVRAMGLESFAPAAGDSSNFSDLDGYDWAEDSIRFAKSMGIISGYGDGTFHPGSEVTYDEAATMLVSALGYTNESLKGFWPANFVTKATELEITKGLPVGAKSANRGNIAIMLYQTIDQNIGYTSGTDWIDPSLDGTRDPDTMITRLGAKKVGPMVIHGNEYSEVNLKSYLGASVTCYTVDDQIIAIAELESEYIKGELDDPDAPTKFTADDEDETEYTLPLSFTNDPQDILYFKNGVEESNSPLTEEGTISVRVNDKKISEVYSFTSWDVSQGAHKKVTKEDIKLISADHELLGCEFEEDKNGEIDLNSFELTGVTSLDKIAVGNIVYVYTSGKYITRVAVSQKTVSGEVSKEHNGKYTINNVEYEVSPQAKISVEVGEKVRVYLDPDGKIYMAENIESAKNYAIVLREAQAGGLDTYKIELFTRTGSKKVFELKDSSLFYKALEFKTGTLVVYETGKDGKINSLTIPKPAGEKLGSTDRLKNGIVGNKLMADNPLIFSFNGKEYKVVREANVKDDQELTSGIGTTGPGLYAVDREDKIDCMIINHSATTRTTSFGLIDSWSNVKNSDGDTVLQIKGVMSGRTISMMADTDISTDRQFDTSAIYRFETDGNLITKITKVTQFTDDLEDGIVDSSSGTTIGAFDVNNVFGTVTDVNNAAVNINDMDYVDISTARAYYPVFDSDHKLSSWAVGRAASILKDYQVLLYQVDEDSTSYDFVIYVRKADLPYVDGVLDFTD